MDFDLAYEKICDLVSGKDTEIPIYCFQRHLRTGEMEKVKSAPIIIFEGLFAIYEDRFRKMMDLKIFVLTPDDIRLSRRIRRDIAERGRSVLDVIAQYNKFVKPSYDDFIKPTMKFADIIVPFTANNEKAVTILCQNLKIKLEVVKKQR